MGISELDGIVIPLISGHAGHIHRILGRAVIGHVFLEFHLHILGSEFQRDAKLFSCIGGQHTHAAAVGDQQNIVPFQGRLERECQRAVEEVVEVGGLDDACLLEGSTINFYCSCQGAGVRGGGRSPML